MDYIYISYFLALLWALVWSRCFHCIEIAACSFPLLASYGFEMTWGWANDHFKSMHQILFFKGMQLQCCIILKDFKHTCRFLWGVRCSERQTQTSRPFHCITPPKQITLPNWTPEARMLLNHNETSSLITAVNPRGSREVSPNTSESRWCTDSIQGYKYS